MSDSHPVPNLLFFEPPPEQQTGGLQAALESLRSALGGCGMAPSVTKVLPEVTGPGAVAHFHGLWQPTHADNARACRRRGIPYLISPHGMLEPWAWRHKRWKKLPYFHLVERRFLSGADCLLATAEPEARNLAAFFPQTKIETIPLGLTSDQAPDYHLARQKLGWTNDEWVLLFLSRIHQKKGLELLIDALVDLGSARPATLRLMIVGGGDLQYIEHLKSYCAARSSALPRIDWCGEIWGEEKWQYFQGTDLFCLPSYSENFGLAVLEACQVGAPVLTTTATPWAGSLGSGRGYIAEPDVHSVAESLRVAFRHGKPDAARRASLADWAHREFSWGKLAARYAALYRRVARL